MIPFLDLKKINLKYSEAFESSLKEVLHSDNLILGERVHSFESEFASYCGTRHCIGVANGLDALVLILQGYKELEILKDGDEVIVPSNTYVASILAVIKAGLTPVLCEPEMNTYLIDPLRIQEKISGKTKAIMAVHLYGRLCNMKSICQIANNSGLIVIEDSAQSHGAIYSDGRKSGNLGDASGFSFYPTKNLGSLGDAGAVTTSDDQLADVIRALRNYGSRIKNVSLYKGMNSRLDELQAAFLSIKLPYLDSDNKARRDIAAFYLNRIKNPKIILPYLLDNNLNIESTTGNAWHIFPVRTAERKELQMYLLDCGIQTVIHYPTPPHIQPGYSEWKHLSFPISEKIHREILSLPLSPVMSKEEVDKVIDIINGF